MPKTLDKVKPHVAQILRNAVLRGRYTPPRNDADARRAVRDLVNRGALLRSGSTPFDYYEPTSKGEQLDQEWSA